MDNATLQDKTRRLCNSATKLKEGIIMDNLDFILHTQFNLGHDRWPKKDPPIDYHDIVRPDLVDKQYGTQKIVSPYVEILGSNTRQQVFVKCECVKCGFRSVLRLRGLQDKRDKCQSCSAKPYTDYPMWLYFRVSAIQNRCESVTNPEYSEYGGKGVKFKFLNAAECANWVVGNLGATPEHKDMILSRIDPEKDYEPQNLTWKQEKQFQKKKYENLRWSSWLVLFRKIYPWVEYNDRRMRYLANKGCTMKDVVQQWNEESHA